MNPWQQAKQFVLSVELATDKVKPYRH